MAKSAKRRATSKAGPFLAAAFFCETIIEDRDGALSAIRIIDQINVTLNPGAPQEIPSETNRIAVPVSCLLSFKTGDSPGEHNLRLELRSPSGKSKSFFEKTLTLSPLANGGANLRLNNTIAVKKGGLFWLDVFLDGKRMTRMPIQISVVRADPAATDDPKIQS